MFSFFLELKGLFFLMVAGIILCLPSIASSDSKIVVPKETSNKISLQLIGNRLTANIKQAALKDVAKMLATTAHAQILVSDTAIARELVSVNIRSSSLEKAIKRILNGFSYALANSSRGLRAVVLSTPPQLYRGGELLMPECINNLSIHPSISSIKAVQADVNSLDEIHQDMQGSGTCETSYNIGNQVSDNSSSIKVNNQEQEAMLLQALNTLESSNTHLYANAIEQLGMLQDDLANATLINLAQNTQKGPERYLATEALARIAVQSEFKNASVMAVLEKLASDQNQDVSRSASQVLEQMRISEEQ